MSANSSSSSLHRPFESLLTPSDSRSQTAADRYAIPENFLEIEVRDPQLHGAGRAKYVDYCVVVKVRYSEAAN